MSIFNRETLASYGKGTSRVISFLPGAGRFFLIRPTVRRAALVPSRQRNSNGAQLFRTRGVISHFLTYCSELSACFGFGQVLIPSN
jgi:hypothetical protein